VAILLAFGIAVVAAFGGWLIRKLSLFVPARLLWRFHDPEELVVVISKAFEERTNVYTRVGTGIGPVRAIAILAPLLSQAYPKLDLERVYLSDHSLQKDQERDLLVLGGPKFIHLSRRILDELGPRFGVQQGMEVSPTAIAWTEGSSTEFYDGNTEDDDIVEDHALIIRARNPFGSGNSTVFLVSGAHTYGNVAAARFIASEIRNPLRHKKYDFVFSKHEFVALVRAKVDQGHVCPPELVHYRTPMTPSRRQSSS
jgi:hypothetical protein